MAVAVEVVKVLGGTALKSVGEASGIIFRVFGEAYNQTPLVMARRAYGEALRRYKMGDISNPLSVWAPWYIRRFQWG